MDHQRHQGVTCMEQGRLVTIGYSEPDAKRRIEDFLASPRTMLVDIRYSPWSRGLPQWRKEAMRERYGYRYLHLHALGNVNYNQSGQPIQLLDPEKSVQAAAQFLQSGWS